MNKFYLTTPIYYVNASPHIGHAYTNIIADCLARFMRLSNKDVFFLTGTDEHGEKIQKAANNKDIFVFVDDVSKNFVELFKTLNISYDFFIRTTFDFHKDTVKEVIKILYQKGDIYFSEYNGFYCVWCETFLTETNLIEGLCPDCKRQVEKVKEKNYFFRLSKYQDWLKNYLRKNPDFIRPKSRYNEVIGFLETNQLIDLCISRPKKRLFWGIDFSVDSDYVVYVWFDALINYISAVGFFNKRENLKKFWPADIHFMAKDILKQHAIYWPIILYALGLDLPKCVFAHGWWKVKDEKMSKSKGNIVDPNALILQLGGKDRGVDSLRYFLLREVPIGMDGNFSFESLINRVNSDLANDLGNLVYRSLNMANKYFNGNISSELKDTPIEFKEDFDLLIKNYSNLMENVEFYTALENIFRFINTINKYIEDKKPWILFRENKTNELKHFIYSILEGIRIISICLYPFIPSTSLSILNQLNLDTSELNIDNLKWAKKEGFSISIKEPLFPRLDVS